MSASLSLKERLELWKSQKQQRQTVISDHQTNSHATAPAPAAGHLTTSSVAKHDAIVHSKEDLQIKSIGSGTSWDRSIPRVSRRRISSTYKVQNPKVITNKDYSDSSSECSKENESPSYASDRKILAIVNDDGSNKFMGPSLREKEKESAQLAALSMEVSRLRGENSALRDETDSLEEQLNESEARSKMAIDEIGALNFLNAVQAMKIDELENDISQERLTMNENASSKTKKHKAEIQKLTNERADYEQMANAMIAQLNNQMIQLQTMAMGRINDLEKQLMEEQRRSAQLEQDVRNASASQRLGASPAVPRPAAMKPLLSQQQLVVDDKDGEEEDGNQSDCTQDKEEDECGSDTEPEDNEN